MMGLVWLLYFCSSLVSWFSLATTVRLHTTEDKWYADSATAVKDVIEASSRDEVSFIIITDKNFSTEFGTFLKVSRGVAVFETGVNGSRLSQIVARARQVRLTSWVVVVVVVSDDPAILAAFAQQSREGRLLVWATRLVVVTRHTPHRLHPLHLTLALTNSLLLLVDGVGKVKSLRDHHLPRVVAQTVLPYQDLGVSPLRVASWNVGRGLSYPRSLFCDKFSKFSKDTNLLVAMEKNDRVSVVITPDPTVPGGVRFDFKGHTVRVIEYLAQALNFSYTFQRPLDGAWGVKLKNGSVTGMVGQVYREEVNIGLGLFAFNAPRYEVIDFTWPVTFLNVRVFAGRGSPEVDPWGFLLPLGPWVWFTLLTSVPLLAIVSFLTTKFLQEDMRMESLSTKNLYFVSIMLRQSVWMDNHRQLWERVVLGVWMLMTLVLTRSYEGNLMSMLAVRHMPQPYQTLRAVLDDPAVVMVWQKQGSTSQMVMDSTSGIFYEVKASEAQGRLEHLKIFEYETILEEVASQRKVIIEYDIITISMNNKYFSQTGRCDFYIGQERILADPLALISQKDSPLIPALKPRIISMSEAGLYNFWRIGGNPNASACHYPSTKTTVISPLSLRQCWIMLVMLAGGLVVGLAALFMEMMFAGSPGI